MLQMKSKFIYQNHFKANHSCLVFKERAGYGDYLNLKSNELHHLKMDALFKKFLKGYDPSLNRKYPIHTIYKKELADFYNVDYNQLMIVPGTNFLIHQVLELITSNTKSLILQSPNYLSYHEYPMVNNTKVIEVNYLQKTEDEFFENFLAVIDGSEPSTVVITNPNGFTGEMIKYDHIESIAEHCFKQNHILIIDEAYVEFSKLDHLKLISLFPNILIIRTLSKSFGFAGLRIGLIFGSQEIVSYLRKFGIENTLSNLILEYLIFLHRDFQAVKKIQCDIVTSRDKFIRFLHDKYPDWHIYKSQTNFVAVDVRTQENYTKLLKAFDKNKIVIKDLDTDSFLNHHIRITMGDKNIFSQLMKVFRDF